MSKERLRGLRIFDITDIVHPKYIGNVQTCRGSHTHTVLADPSDKENVYVYISGSSGVRPAEELAGCVNAAPDKDPNSALFRIEVIKVPLSRTPSAPRSSRKHHRASSTTWRLRRVTVSRQKTSPRQRKSLMQPARVAHSSPRSRARNSCCRTISSSRCWTALSARTREPSRPAPTAPPFAPRFRECSRRCSGEPATDRAPVRRSATTSTVFPAIGLAGGACEGYGLLLDIHNPTTPYGSARSPTRTSPTGTRPRSTTTAPRFCSPTSGAAVVHRSAVRRTRSSGAPTPSSRSITGR